MMPNNGPYRPYFLRISIANSRIGSNYKVQVEQEAVARAHTGVVCHPGDPASGDPQNYYGTLGWNFYLNHELVCLSNWHVFCKQGNETPIGASIAINGSVEATLYTFQRLYPSGNVYDYALARYIQPDDAAGIMRACDNGQSLPYPRTLSPRNSVIAGDGRQYNKVGAREPTCRTGTLVGVIDCAVKYDDGVTRSFQSQLLFSKMTDPGDSGAIVVREDDTSVTGLNFAGSETQTIANPIFLADWHRDGVIRLDNGTELPVFSGSLALWTGLVRQTEARIDSKFRSTELQFDLPNLTSGLLYLGTAKRRWNIVDLHLPAVPVYFDGGPPPPPIRPGIQVQVVIASKEGMYGPQTPPDQSAWIETLLYFG
jgi:hypothetical protein